MGVGSRTILVGVCASIALLAFAWSYAPTGVALWRLWSSEPDYSHGFFVVPLAIAFAWYRRAKLPVLRPQLSVVAVVLLSAPIAMRILGQRWNLAPLEYWSILPWVAGVVWTFGGAAGLRWCWPSIAILVFMMPLPYRVEQAMSMPLQTVATRASCWTLQTLGQNALAEGHTILLGDQRLEIEQACSGLRMVLSATVMGFAYAIFSQRRNWERALLAACAIPVAIAGNVGRIVLTGMARVYWPDSLLAKLSHDGGGYLMIVITFCLYQLIYWYLTSLVYPLPEADGGDLDSPSVAPLAVRYLRGETTT